MNGSTQLMHRPPLLVRYGNYLFRTRDALFPAALLALFFGFRPAYPQGSEQLDNLLDAAGLLIAILGQALRVLTIGHVYIIRGGRNRRIYAQGLVTEGMFAHSRNPLYLGNILVLLGLFVIHGSIWVFALGIPLVLISYIAMVAAEEEYLGATFGGAYEAYRREVPRWLPRLDGLANSLRKTRFDWRRVILKEYSSTYTWAAGVMILLAMDTLAYHAYRDRADYLNRLWICLALLTVGWAAVRYLKKSRRLRERPAHAAPAATAASTLPPLGR